MIQGFADMKSALLASIENQDLKTEEFQVLLITDYLFPKIALLNGGLAGGGVVFEQVFAGNGLLLS